MENRIYCFSGTGNSLKVARDLAAGIGSCEIIPVNSSLLETIDAENHSNFNRIGFCFPVYAWGPPRIIRMLIDKLRIPENSYCFAVTTCASSPGLTIPFLGKKLHKKKGFASLPVCHPYAHQLSEDVGCGFRAETGGIFCQ